MEAAGEAIKEGEGCWLIRLGGEVFFFRVGTLLLHRIDGQLEFCLEQKEITTA